MDTMIDVKDISKKFKVHEKAPGLLSSFKSLFYRKWKYKQALSNINLTVQPGEILGLLGANGAGKTTLIKILSGIIHPTSGQARVLGHNPWKRHNDFRRQISLIMGQKAQLWWDLPAGDCFLLLKEIYNIPKKQFEENINFLSNTLQVEEQLNIQIRRLSLGERMKMELIAALLHNPKVVFLDEPTIGLDITGQRAIRKFILQYRQKYQPAMIITSHYIEDIEKLCERIVILRKGKTVYDGSFESIITKYSSHKSITATTHNSSSLQQFSIPEEMGTILEKSDTKLKVRVTPPMLSIASSYILQHIDIADLTIEGDDIGSIIERLQQNGS